MSLRTTSPVMARRLATQLDAILEDAAMLAENTDLHLSRSQIETMLGAVVERHLTKLDRVALAAKTAAGFDVDRARSDDKRALWTYTLLDAQGAAAVVCQEDRVRMAADGLSEADIEAVQDHLAMLRINELVPTKHHILRQMIDGVEAAPAAMNVSVSRTTTSWIASSFRGAIHGCRFHRLRWIARIAVAIHRWPNRRRYCKLFR
jgi:hypothetical protein